MSIVAAATVAIVAVVVGIWIVFCWRQLQAKQGRRWGGDCSQLWHLNSCAHSHTHTHCRCISLSLSVCLCVRVMTGSHAPSGATLRPCHMPCIKMGFDYFIAARICRNYQVINGCIVINVQFIGVCVWVCVCLSMYVWKNTMPNAILPPFLITGQKSGQVAESIFYLNSCVQTISNR